MAASSELEGVTGVLDNNLKCYLHIVDDAKSDVKPLTSKRLKTLAQIKDWKG